MITPGDEHDVSQLPYRIAVLCYLYDADDRVLLLHRVKEPNAGMYSPIGGKLEVSRGEGPHQCAAREIHEEAGLAIPPEKLHLTGIVTERAYEHQNHWLIFLFEVLRPIEHDEITQMNIEEGALEWIDAQRVPTLDIPDTDRRIMWPLVHEHRGGFFTVHIDCSGDEITWSVHDSMKNVLPTG